MLLNGTLMSQDETTHRPSASPRRRSGARSGAADGMLLLAAMRVGDGEVHVHVHELEGSRAFSASARTGSLWVETTRAHRSPESAIAVLSYLLDEALEVCR